MKTKILILTVLLCGFIIQRNYAQCSVTNNTYTVTAFLGWNSPSGSLPFETNGNVYMTLSSGGYLGIGTASPAHLLDVCGGDIDVNTSCSGNYGYMIGGSHVLWVGSGTGNTMVGETPSNPSGSYNTLLGFQAGDVLSSGGQNTFIGVQAGDGTLASSDNTATGFQAFYSNSNQGFFNTADGYQALYNTLASNNTGIGNQALYNNNTGIDNTAIGSSATYTTTTASAITAVGNYAGYKNIASYNTFLGDSAGINLTVNTYTNVVCLGYLSGPPASQYSSDCVYLGNTSTAHIEYDHAIFTQWSDRRVKDNIQANVPGLAFITKITPVTFNYDIAKENEVMGIKNNNTSGEKQEVEKITQSGFIAQQVDSAAQACGYDFSGVVKPTTPGGLYGLGYMEFVVPLVKSVQELNTKNESLNSKVDSLTNIIQNMQTCLNQICGATGANNGAPASVQTIALSNTNAPLLYQNTPNPFGTGGTKINYYLPEGTMGATLVFYDTYGNPIKTVQLSQTGNGTLNITSDNLSSGIYSYSLIVNSNIIDTKKMMLQK